jgi:hypothetical protein
MGVIEEEESFRAHENEAEDGKSAHHSSLVSVGTCNFTFSLDDVTIRELKVTYSYSIDSLIPSQLPPRALSN